MAGDLYLYMLWYQRLHSMTDKKTKCQKTGTPAAL